jgi:hypothetical protein
MAATSDAVPLPSQTGFANTAALPGLLTLLSVACTAADADAGGSYKSQTSFGPVKILSTVVSAAAAGLQEHCCFVDVHGSTVTEPGQLAAAIQQARAAVGNSSSSSGTGQLQEADHVYNPDKQDAPGERKQRTQKVTICVVLLRNASGFGLPGKAQIC